MPFNLHKGGGGGGKGEDQRHTGIKRLTPIGQNAPLGIKRRGVHFKQRGQKLWLKGKVDRDKRQKENLIHCPRRGDVPSKEKRLAGRD